MADDGHARDAFTFAPDRAARVGDIISDEIVGAISSRRIANDCAAESVAQIVVEDRTTAA